MRCCLPVSTGLGYLAGPTLGASFWSLLHAKQRQQIDEKDKKFYEHIVKMRVDPSRQTMQNRLPDYYVRVGAGGGSGLAAMWIYILS